MIAGLQNIQLSRCHQLTNVLNNQPPMFAGKRSDLWRTPDSIKTWLFYNYKFDIDLAADEENTLARTYCSEGENSFFNLQVEHIRNRTCWLNPPFSKALLFYQRLAKLRQECDFTLVGIYKANLETEVWQDFILPNIDWLLALRRRVSYDPPPGIDASEPQFTSVLFGWGCEPPIGFDGHVLMKR